MRGERVVSPKPGLVREPEQVGTTILTMHWAEVRGNKQAGKEMREYVLFDYFQS